MQESLIHSGSPLKTAIRLSIPAIAEQLLITATSYVDTIMVGTLGAAATASISVTSTCMWLINGIIMALGVGYSVRVAYFIGAQHPEEVRAVQGQAVFGSLLLGLVATGIGVPLSFFLPVWMGAEEAILGTATGYLFTMMISLLPRAFSTVFSSVLRCMGDTRKPMLINTAVNLLNIVLNFLMIYPTREVTLGGFSLTVYGMGFGVVGAGAATAIAVTFGAALMTREALFRRPEFTPSRRQSLHPISRIQRQVIGIAVPVALERITISTGQIIMTRMIATLGTVALAANYTAVTAEEICYMPAYGIATAATALVGQAVGAAEPRTALRFGKLTGWIGVGLTVIMAAGMFLASDFLGSIFSSDAEVAALSARMLRIVSVAEPMFSMFTIMAGAHRGAGDARFPFLAGMVCMLGIRVPLAAVLLFSFHLGLSAVWIAMAVDLNLRGIVSYIHFRKASFVKEIQREEI